MFKIKVIGKRVCEAIGNQLVRFEWFRREVQAYEDRQAKQLYEQKMQRNKDHWADLMKSGGSMRSEDKEDDSMKVVELFNPVFSRMDCVNWGERNKRYDRI